MNSLQILVESIVADLIKARHEADLVAAQLASHYRDNPTLRMLNVPTLNISNVSIDLRFAFDDSPIEAPKGPSDDQKIAIAAAAAELHRTISTMKSVRDTITVARQRTAFFNKVKTVAIKMSSDNIMLSSEDRLGVVNKEVKALFTSNQIRLSAEDKRQLTTALNQLEATISTAPKAPAKVPGIVVGSQALADLNPAFVSSVKFDIDLSSARWTAVDGGDGEPDAVLTEN